MSLADKIYEAVKPLSETLAREVLDFVEFLRARREQCACDNLTAAQASSMHVVWDNPDDEAWNDATTGRDLLCTGL
ncbi:MAG: DUF2281 domain-containing protein [Gammaproteobacteria bacterium]